MPTLTPLVGRIGTLRERSWRLAFAVRVLDTKTAYGADRVLVTPVAGSGEAWVNVESVVFDDVDNAA
jgi:hypothetical protein